jgi:hypothetical protein
VIAVFLVCLLLFVDVSLPLVGNSSRLLAFLIFPLLLFGGGGVRATFCVTMLMLIPLYILVPIMFFPDDVGTFEAGKGLALGLLSVAGMVLLARALAIDHSRRQLTDILVLFALISAVVATLQRFGFMGPVGRDRWGYSTTALGELRGAGFLADPNYLAIMLASIVPLIVSWRFAWLRAPALVVIALGLYATNSRAGILLAALALIASLATRTRTANAGHITKGRKLVYLVAVALVALFALNVGGQRDRAIQALLIEVGIENNLRTEHAVDAFVAHERRDLLDAWIDMGTEHFPVGVGTFPQPGFPKAAHNTFVTLFGQGGIIGLAIVLTILACLMCFVHRRMEPFAIMGIVIVLGAFTLSYAGAYLILPMGLADGILAAQLGLRVRAGPKLPANKLARNGSSTTK